MTTISEDVVNIFDLAYDAHVKLVGPIEYTTSLGSVSNGPYIECGCDICGVLRNLIVLECNVTMTESYMGELENKLRENNNSRV